MTVTDNLSQNVSWTMINVTLCMISLDDRHQYFQSHLASLCEKRQEKEFDTVVILLGESKHGDSWFYDLGKFVSNLKELSFVSRVFLVCDSWYQVSLQDHDVINCFDDVSYLDLSLIYSHHAIINDKIPLASGWDPDNNKILFLMNQPQRFHRIRLLYKLLTSPLAEDLFYSFQILEEHEKQQCRNFLLELSDEEFYWLLDKQRSIKGKSTAEFSAVKIPHDCYESSLFQLISETDFDQPCFQTPWITEKTWMSILHRRPFVIAGEFYSLDHLEKLGFHNFREFLPIPNYDNPDRGDFLEYGPISGKSGFVVTQEQLRQWKIFYSTLRLPSWPEYIEFGKIDDYDDDIRELKKHYTAPIENIHEIRLDAIIENASHLKQNISKYHHEIRDMVDENYQRSISLAEQNLQNFINWTSKNKINNLFIVDIFRGFRYI